jgi:hypothetical protein
MKNAYFQGHLGYNYKILIWVAVKRFKNNLKPNYRISGIDLWILPEVRVAPISGTVGPRITEQRLKDRAYKVEKLISRSEVQGPTLWDATAVWKSRSYQSFSLQNFQLSLFILKTHFSYVTSKSRIGMSHKVGILNHSKYPLQAKILEKL